MRAIDASSIIYGWDTYPIEQFPKLWEWLAEEIEFGQLRIPAAAMEEITHKVPECAAWLIDCGCMVEGVTNEILRTALAIKELLGIENDQFNSNGVGENDILIIATAKVHGHTLVSNESRQPNPPTRAKSQKIPRVCAHASVGVECQDFSDYFKSSGKVF